MTKQTITCICVLLAATVITIPDTLARKKKSAPKVELTQTGQKLEKQYATELEALKKEITKAIPNVSQAKKSAVTKARSVELAANQALAEAQKNMGAIKQGRGLVAHAKGKWIGGAEKGIKAAKAKLKNAKTAMEAYFADYQEYPDLTNN